MCKRFPALATVLSLALSFSAQAAPRKNAKPTEFLWISDIHFNPFADPALVDKLAAAPSSEWAAILDSSTQQRLAAFGDDANWPLFSSALIAIKKTIPGPAFTIVTGDLLAHHFRDHFNETASVHDDAAFRAFVRKTVEFTGAQLKQLSPATRTMVALGNNDAECGDYQIEPHGSFLADSADTVGALAGLAGDAAFSTEWNAAGSYSVANPALKGHRILLIDTSFFSTRYRNACGSGKADPGHNLLGWLATQLADAKQRHKKVWLVSHIPPGIDGYSTARSAKTNNNGQATPFWNAADAQGFDDLLVRYKDTIQASFAGHIHVDDFRLVDRETQHPSLVLIAPALGPNAGQSPAFRTVRFTHDGKLTDQSTYYLSNLETASNRAAADWKLEYSFDQAWAFHQVNYANCLKLWLRAEKPSEAREQWMRFYTVSHPAGVKITPQSFPYLYCASGNTDAAQYQACVQSMK